jgi:lysophospholipase L1-like esterase
VINGGTLGYSTDQELLFYRLEGRRYQPDLVIVLFCSNDLYFNTTGEQGKPWFEIEGDRLVLQGSPVRAKKGQWQRGPEARTAEITPLHGSMALRLIAERAVGHPRVSAALAFLHIVEPPKVEPIPMEMTPLGNLHPEVKTMWAVTDALLARLKSEVEADGGRLAVLYIPDRFQLSDRIWELTEQRYGMGKRFSPDRIYLRLKRACEEQGVPFLDPLEALRAAEAAGRSGYFPEDGHWNETGHAIAARTIAAWVRQAAGPRAASTSASLAP